jgi:hypothetical protein
MGSRSAKPATRRVYITAGDGSRSTSSRPASRRRHARQAFGPRRISTPDGAVPKLMIAAGGVYLSCTHEVGPPTGGGPLRPLDLGHCRPAAAAGRPVRAFGSEGWRFESLRARFPHLTRPEPVVTGRGSRVRDRVTATGIARATQVEQAPRWRFRPRHNRSRWMADATDVPASADVSHPAPHPFPSRHTLPPWQEACARCVPVCGRCASTPARTRSLA